MNERNYIRVSSWLTLISVLLSGVGCTQSEQEKQTAADTSADTSSNVTEETRISADLPERDFGEAEFTIIQRYVGDGHIHNFFEYDAEEQNGDLLNDAIYERNRKIEERFNVQISADNNESPAAKVNTLVMAGDCQYNIVADRPVELAKYSLNGTFTSIENLAYVNINNPWWNKNANEAFSVEDKLCFITGDYVLYEKQRLPVMLFNSEMAEQFGLDDMYKLVHDGGWTVDVMNEYASIVKSDLNGDSEMKYSDDRYGLLEGSFTYIPFMLFGMGNRYSEKLPDGSYSLTLTSQHMLDSIDKLGKTLFDDTTVYGEVVTNQWKDADSPQYVFEEGRALFYNEVVYVIRTIDGDISYGILPQPKYDEAQEKYMTTVQYDNSGAIAVPVSLSDDELEMTGIILEALGEESHYSTLPAFIEGVMQTKKAPDEKSSENLELIFDSDNIVYDMFAAYNIGNLNWLVADNLYKGHGDNYVSSMEAKKQAIVSEYEKIIEKFKEIN